MTVHTEEQNLLARVDELDAEIGELGRRKGEALAVIRRAERRFEELDKRRKELSPKTFFGDSAASLELEALEDEHDTLSRSVRVAKSAVPEFERMLEEAKAKRREAQEDVYRERYRTLAEERAKLDTERDELAQRLKEVLEKKTELGNRMQQEVRGWDGEQANDFSLQVMDEHQYWLNEEFRQWLR
jgi:predicted  nucleic acid-binding Zn-ribbon protein